MYPVTICLQFSVISEKCKNKLLDFFSTALSHGFSHTCPNNILSTDSSLFQVNDEGYTPLMEAAREGHEEMVALLLAQGTCSFVPLLGNGNGTFLLNSAQLTSLIWCRC